MERVRRLVFGNVEAYSVEVRKTRYYNYQETLRSTPNQAITVSCSLLRLSPCPSVCWLADSAGHPRMSFHVTTAISHYVSLVGVCAECHFQPTSCHFSYSVLRAEDCTAHKRATAGQLIWGLLVGASSSLALLKVASRWPSVLLTIGTLRHVVPLWPDISPVFHPTTQTHSPNQNPLRVGFSREHVEPAWPPFSVGHFLGIFATDGVSTALA